MNWLRQLWARVRRPHTTPPDPFEGPEKVTFDHREKLIQVRPSAVLNSGTLVLDVQRDIYSAARRWEASEEGIVFPKVVEAEGGNVLPGGVRMPLYVILQNSWKVQCPDNCDRVEIVGTLLSSDGQAPFIARPDGRTISYEKVRRLPRKVVSLGFILSILLLGVAMGFIVRWIRNTPDEMEPYATLLITLFTLVQVIAEARRR